MALQPSLAHQLSFSVQWTHQAEDLQDWVVLVEVPLPSQDFQLRTLAQQKPGQEMKRDQRGFVFAEPSSLANSNFLRALGLAATGAQVSLCLLAGGSTTISCSTALLFCAADTPG